MVSKPQEIIAGIMAPRDGVRIFGVGAAKTGTHSFGEMFADRVRSAHECDVEKLINLHLDSLESSDRGALRRYLRWRDATRKLKIDASQVNIYLINELLDIWPDSRFVLTIRPPMTWLRSFIDHSLRDDLSPTWLRFRDYRLVEPGPRPEEERALTDRGLYSLSGYLKYWADSISRVTDTIPAEQLLIVETDTLHQRSAEIATYCGVPGGGVSAERSHAFANTTRFGALSDVPEPYLYDLAEGICGSLMKAHFSDRDLRDDIRSIQAA